MISAGTALLISGLIGYARLTGARSGPGGFTGTLYDGGFLLADLRDKAHTLCANQAGMQAVPLISLAIS